MSHSPESPDADRGDADAALLAVRLNEISSLPLRANALHMGFVIMDGMGHEIGCLYSHSATHERRRLPMEGNARYLVLVANVHHDAISALRELVRAWDATQFPVSERMEAALKDADAVLAKVEAAT